MVRGDFYLTICLVIPVGFEKIADHFSGNITKTSYFRFIYHPHNKSSLGFAATLNIQWQVTIYQ